MTPQAGISVIVRSIGRASLGMALASVDAQGRGDVEIVLVDASARMTSAPATRCPLRIVGTGQPLLRTAAANAGLAAVRTQHALFLDDDDELLPGHLDKLTAALDAAPDAVLAHTGVELVRGDDGDGAERTSNVIDEAFEPWELLLGNRLPIHAVLFDAARVQSAGISFDQSFDLYEDWDFWLQLSQLGRFVHAPGVSARYLIGPASSDVHRIAHGDEAYFRLWRKWWPRAPQDWWAKALRAAVDAPAMKRDLAGERARGAELLRHLHSTREGLSATQAALHSTQQTLTQTQQQVAALAADVTQLHGTLGEQVAHATAITAALQQAQAELHDTQGTLAATRIERQRVADELHTLRMSSSWRVTRPLRDAVDALRQWRQRLGSLRRQWRGPRLRRGDYARWIAGVEAAQIAERRAALVPRARAAGSLVSVLMPVFNAEHTELDAAIQSVCAQGWPRWQLCIADDASTRPGLREQLRAWAAREPRVSLVERASNGHISAASNSALALARGDWVVLLDQDDLLAPSALAEVVDAADRVPDAGLIYSDEDKLDGRGRRFEPNFKPAFSVELLRGQNFLNHLVAYRRTLLADIGGFREGFEGAQDHDLALRATERLRPEQVVHVPRVLYHWRAGAGSTAASGADKPYALAAAHRAVQDSLSRCEPQAQAEPLPALGYLRVRYPLPQPMPLMARANDTAERIEAAALVLVCRDGLQGQEGWLDELVAQVSRPGVGVAAACITRDGLLRGGAYEATADGQTRIAHLGSDPQRGGHFGRHALTQAVAAVTPSCMLMRRELWPLWQRQPEAIAFGAAVRAAGWRIVWTPFARLEDPAP